MPLLDELMDLERRGWDSLCDGTGHEFYPRLMSDDGVMVVAGGTVLDRDQVAASLADAPPWRHYEITDERLVHVPGGGAALVYRGTAWRSEEEPFVAAMTSVYARVDDAWRLAVYTQTPLA